MSTIDRIVEQLRESGPLSTRELAKALKVSSGAVSGATWRLREKQVVSKDEHDRHRLVDGAEERLAKMTTRSSPRRHAAKRTDGDTAVQCIFRLRVQGRVLELTLKEASELYGQLHSIEVLLRQTEEGG